MTLFSPQPLQRSPRRRSQEETGGTWTIKTTLVEVVMNWTRDLTGRKRLRAGWMLRKRVTVVLLLNERERSAKRMPSQASTSAGELPRILKAVQRWRRRDPITNAEDFVDLHGSAPSCMIGQVDPLFLIGVMSLDRTKGLTEGWPASDVGSTTLTDLPALLRGTFASAVGVPRGGMGPLRVATTSRAGFLWPLSLMKLAVGM